MGPLSARPLRVSCGNVTHTVTHCDAAFTDLALRVDSNSDTLTHSSTPPTSTPSAWVAGGALLYGHRTEVEA